MFKIPDTMPITTIVIGGFVVYAAGVTVIKKIKNKFTSFLVKTDNRVELPPEIWERIVKNYLQSRDDEYFYNQVLNLSTVNRFTSKLIDDYCESCFNRAEYYPVPENPLFTLRPRLCFGLRSKNHAISALVYCGPKDPIYGIWMPSNLIKAPETLWKFLLQILIKPSWIYHYITNGLAGRGTFRSPIFQTSEARLRPLLWGLRVLALAPLCDYLLTKFSSGEYSGLNLAHGNVLDWSQVIKVLLPVSTLMSTQTLESSLYNYDGFILRAALYALIMVMHHGFASLSLPIILGLVLNAYLTGSRSFGQLILALVVLIAGAILFPANLVFVAHLIHTLVDFLAFNREYRTVSYRLNLIIAMCITIGSILYQLKH